MSGILHLRHVHKLTGKQVGIERVLFKAIRDASATGNGRDIPMEDFYHEVVSFMPIREPDVALVRFANVDSKGRPFGNLSLVDTLYSITVSQLKSQYLVVKRDDKMDERFDHYYNVKAFEDTDFLFAPDSNYVKNIIVLDRKKPPR